MRSNITSTLACILFVLTMTTVSCSKNIQNKPEQTQDGPGSLDGNEPEGSDETTPQPQPANVVAPYVGVWENDALSIVFLVDGRTAAVNRLSGGVPLETGYYHINDNGTIDMEWRFSGHEHHFQQFHDGIYTLGTQDLQQTAQADAAPGVYDQIYQALISESAPFNARFTVGAITNSPSDPSDPHPGNVIADATVYNGNGAHFADSYGGPEWYEMPDHTINKYDSYSRVDLWLLPNGRFSSEMWLWKGVDVHDYAHVNHYLSWGKYSVTPATDLIKGDVVNVVYDNGRTATYRAVGGRRYLRTQSIIYHNWALK